MEIAFSIQNYPNVRVIMENVLMALTKMKMVTASHVMINALRVSMVTKTMRQEDAYLIQSRVRMVTYEIPVFQLVAANHFYVKSIQK